MERKRLDLTALRALYETELARAFPPAERKPFREMERLLAAGCYEPLAFFDEKGLAGYALLWTGGATGTVLLDYLGVPAHRQGQGLGSAILAALWEELDGRLLILEAEAPDGGAQDGEKRRRLAFYRRAGCEFLPYDCALFGVHFRCMARNWDGRTPVLEQHRALYRRHLPPEAYARYIRLPLAPGEAPPKSIHWSDL